jgi:RNA polymerase sigma factor FliA
MAAGLAGEQIQAESRAEKRVTSEQVLEHLYLVYPVVSAFLRRLPFNVTKDDLLAAGTIGLFDALRRSDPNIPTFRSYANLRIRGAIIDELREQDWLTRRARLRSVGFSRVPEEILETYAATVEEELPEVSLECLPEREQHIVRRLLSGVKHCEIAAELGVSQERISQLYRRAVGILRESVGRKAA